MPIYEYECGACGHRLDALQKINERPLKQCPSCGKPRLKRLLSAPMFLLKGSGWYETDFKSDKEQKRNLADRPDQGKDKEEKPEAKPAAQAEPGTDKKDSPQPESKPEPKTAAKSESQPAAGRRTTRTAPRKSSAARVSTRPKVKSGKR